MKIIVTGATGMVGYGVLQTALQDPQITEVLSLSRKPVGLSHPKLKELIVPDFYNLESLADRLTGYDACLHSLGVSAVGMTEADYKRVTHDLSLHLAQTLLRLNPAMSFAYVSGKGTDAASSTMWARVKGQTENDLLALPFRHVHMFRPGFIRAAPGARSSTPLYRFLYILFRPFFPLILLSKDNATTSERLAAAMIRATRAGYSQPILESRDINALGA